MYNTNEVHIFDVDYTLLKRSTAYFFLRQGLQEKLISVRQIYKLPFEYLRYKIGFANHDFIEDAVRHLAGISNDILIDLARKCFDLYIKPNLYPQGITLIQSLQKKGCTVLLATSSFKTIIKPLEDFLGLEESIASELEFIDGKTSGKLSGKALFGINKKEAAAARLAERGIDRANVWFYSDSYIDLPLLEFAGHPVAVNADRFLLKAARKAGWQTLNFKNRYDKFPSIPVFP